MAEAVGVSTLDPWQREILTDAARKHHDRWSAFEVVALVPRQNGKTFLIALRALAGCLLYGERLVLYSAHEYRTAQETWRLMMDLCETDAVKPYLARVPLRRSGSEEIEFTNGSRFKLIARTRSSGRGFSPDTLLLDEAFALSSDVMSAVLPSVVARPNPQVWYFSSAGTWESEVLLGLRRRGHSGVADDMAYWEWHADPSADLADPRTWACVNPAYGRRLSRQSIAREHQTMTPKAFARERCGIWSETATEAVFREHEITDNVVPVPPRPPRDRFVGWGVDVAGDRSGSAICAAYRDDNGCAVLVLVESRAGASWLPERMSELWDDHDVDGFAYDHHGGITDLMERAEREWSVPVLALKHAQYPTACANIAQRVSEGVVRWANAPALITDAVSGTARHTATGWVWDRKVVTPPTHLIAATCALYALEANDGGAVAVQ